MEEFFKYLSNPNSQQTFLTLKSKIENYERETEKKYLDFSEKDIIEFFKKYYNNKKPATICNAITMIRKLFNFYNKDLEFLKIQFLKDNGLNVSVQEYFSPSELKELTDSLQNAQDQALVMLIYNGLYDNDFQTIRNLKKDFIYEIQDSKFKISPYLEGILFDAALEEFNYNLEGKTYDLNDTDYLFRGRISKNKGPLSSVTLKKRLKLMSDYLGIEDFTAIKIKHSRTIYDIVKYENIIGRDLKRNEIRDFLIMKDIKASVEQIEFRKKKCKNKMLKDIENEKDYYLG